MKIGVDFDGTVTKNTWYKGKVGLPWWLIFMGVIILEPFIRPKKEVVDALIRWAKENNDEIIVISVRPKELNKLTEAWLLKYKIPFNQLVLVGVGQEAEKRKLKAMQELGVEFYLDDDPTIVEYLRKNGVGVRAHCFS